MTIDEAIKELRKPYIKELFLDQDGYEDLEDEWRAFLRDKYGEDVEGGFHAIPFVKEEYHEKGYIHFLIRGKPVIMRQGLKNNDS